MKYFDRWLVDHNTYTNTDDKNTYFSGSESHFYSHSSYGTLFMGYGVCESFARSMARLLDAAGIPSVFVTGFGDGDPHAWNYILAPDGQYHMQDATWDRTKSTSRYILGAWDGDHIERGYNWKGEYFEDRAFTYPSISNQMYIPKLPQIVLKKGESKTLDDYGSGHLWVSDNPLCASFGEDTNTITGNECGTTDIRLEADDRIYHTTVTVYDNALEYSPLYVKRA